MYWPIGSPNIYALSKHKLPRERVSESQDGLSQARRTASSGSIGKQSEQTAVNQEGRRESTRSERSSDSQASTASETISHEEPSTDFPDAILSAKASRGGTIFASISAAALTVWQAKPTVALARIVRSAQSIKTYGPNTDLLFRPDALAVIVRTTQNYLIVYSIAADPNARVYQTEIVNPTRTQRNAAEDYGNVRKQSTSAIFEAGGGPAEGDGIVEVSIRFRMVMRIDAGIHEVLALDDELVVATQKPAALQCIRWPNAEGGTPKVGPQTSTELLSRIAWVAEPGGVVFMVHDRPMNLICWIMRDGRVYAVQRRSPANVDMDNMSSLFQGYCFSEPEDADPGSMAVSAAIDARFSLIAVGCADGEVNVYVVKDYTGNIPLSHTLHLPVGQTASGALQCLTYSPDGYCLFAGYEKGWVMWSVYGKIIASSFTQDRAVSTDPNERWLQGITHAFWIGNGCELAIANSAEDTIWVLDVARSASTGCYAHANLLRGLLVSSTQLKLYKGHEVADPATLTSDLSLWQTVQIPASYLLHQWPVKSAVISPDGKYIAVAGRRGLAHYSIPSGRWRLFDDLAAEHQITVRGGMCWFRHYLIAGIETEAERNRYQIRVYSREKALGSTHALHVEPLSSPAIFISTSGSESLLVYTHENTLLHFIILTNASGAFKLVQVGQIGFHGIIRAPPRVRAISWVLPEDHLVDGDPAQDVAKASTLFLVDGKLVLLQPSHTEEGELKYDMRVVANNVEYFFLLRDIPATEASSKKSNGVEHLAGNSDSQRSLSPNLRDSLWYFDGTSLNLWLDVHEVLATASTDGGRDLPAPIRIPVDFYPLFAIDNMGIVSGLETDLVQRKDIHFSFLRLSPRTQLFLPQLLRHHLTEYNSPAALHLSQSFQHLPYFPHALEVLLHDILDAEVDSPPASPETAMLPPCISFLSSFPSYLDVIVNCTRKTELRSWKTLFSHLPPVMELFEQALLQGKLKTAAGYLLVFHTLQDEDEDEHQGFHGREYARLLKAAVEVQDWELCNELARFLMGIDGTGATLRTALLGAGLTDQRRGRQG